MITINSGAAQSKEFGALTHIGQDETIAGEAVGDELNKRGRKNALCVLHEQGNVGLEQRCAGAKETFDGRWTTSTSTAPTCPTCSPPSRPSSSPTSPSTPSSRWARRSPTTAAKASDQAGSKAEIDTFDLNPQVATSLKDGTLGFAVDQQPYLQGYEAVDLLWLYRYNADMLGGGQPVLTGPQIVTKDDADALLAYAKRGTR